MTMHFVDKKPAIEELMHFGVLGMKWGHRKAGNASDIRSARASRRSQKQAIAAQEDKVASTKKGTSERSAAEKKLNDMSKKYLTDSDRVIAARMTRGEKVVSVLLLGPIGLTAIAGTSMTSRRIERKQETGAYNK